MRGYLITILVLVTNVIHAQVVVDFTVDQDRGCGIVQSQFTDQSSSTAGAIVNWDWDLGGVGSTQQNPGRVFSEPGLYTICLTVTDDAGNSGSLCKDDFIEVLSLPEVSFNATQTSGCVPLEIEFRNTSVSNGVDQLIWDLGGQTGVLQGGIELDTVVGEYLTPDDYTVSLTVVDAAGCLGILSLPGFISAGGFEKPDLTVDEPVGCSAPHTSRMAILNPQPGAEYTWRFNNGIELTGSDLSNVAFADAGTYDLELIAFDPQTACTDTFHYSDIVSVGVDVRPSASNYEVCVGSQVSFSDTSAILADSVLWDFGDGNQSNEPEPRHRFENPGCYEVQLIKWLDDCSVTIVLETCIAVIEPPELTMVFDRLASCILPAEFNLAISGPPLELERWFLGDSLVHSGLNLQVQMDTLGSIPFKFRGRYAQGCWIEIIDTLYSGPFEVEIEPLPDLGCVPVSASLEVSSQFNLSSYNWDLLTSPPQKSTDSKPEFDITQPGNYDVQVIVESDQGCIDTASADGLVRAGAPPDVAFEADILSSCSDTTINFSIQSTDVYNEAIWDFGDGASSLALAPGHVYTDTGYFTVSLLLGYNGCYRLDSIVDYIYIDGPVAGFTFSYDCDADSLYLTDRTVAADIVSYEIKLQGTTVFTSDLSDPVAPLSAPGLYEITQTTENFTTGCVDQFVDTLLIESPILDISLDSTRGCAPFTVEVINNSVGVAQWEWKVPGGAISDDSTASPTNTFRRPGIYDVFRVFATDVNGCRSIQELDLEVLVGAAEPEVYAPVVLCPDSEVTLFESGNAYIPYAEWEWILGDSLFLSDAEAPTFLMEDTGVYSLTLSVTDSLGCVATIEIDTMVLVQILDLGFSGDTVSCPDVVSEYKIDSPEPGINYVWSVDGMVRDSGRRFRYTFPTDGSYEICMGVDGGDYCDSLFCRTIEVISPEADFTADVQFSDCPPLLVNFSNASVNANSFIWNFGDSSGISSIENPGNVYAEPGVFDVELIAANTAKCADTLRIEDMIRVEGPSGDFAYEADGLCVPIGVSFVGTSDNDYDYIWDFGNGILDSTTVRTDADSTFVQYLSAGKYVPRLILINSDNCRRTLVGDTIEVSPVTEAAIQMDSSFCLGDSLYARAQVLGSGLASLTWTSNVSMTCDTCIGTSLLSDTIVGIYLTTYHESGCEFVDSALSIPVVPPSLSLIDTVSYCMGDSIQLEVTADRPGDFAWNVDPQVSACITCPELSLPSGLTGYLTVEFVDSDGCRAIDSVNLQMVLDSTDLLVPEVIVCLDDSLQIEITNVSDVDWSTEGRADCDTCLSINMFADRSFEVQVSAIGPSGCRIRDTSVITALEKDFIDAGIDQVVCAGEDVFLNAIVDQGEAWWTTNPVIADTSALTTVFAPDSNVVLYLNGVVGTCLVQDTVVIDVLYEASIDAVGDSICFGDTAMLIAVGDVDGYEWYTEEWQFVQSDTAGDLTIVPEISGLYNVIGYRTVCEPDTERVSVLVSGNFDYSLPDEVVVYPGEEFTVPLDIQGSGVSVAWEGHPGLSCSSCLNPSLIIDTSTLLSIQFEELASGCRLSDSLYLRVPSRCNTDFLYVPNVFSPNGDGINDELSVASVKLLDLVRFSVFDRWGSVVYSSDDFGFQWNGTYNGTVLPSGVYTYLATVICPIDQTPISKYGTITIVR